MIQKTTDKLKNLFFRFSENTSAKKVAYNSTWSITEKVIVMVLSLAITPIISRYFGPNLYGTYNYALSLVTIFTSISTLGLPNITVKTLIEKDYEEDAILGTSLVLRIFGGFLLMMLAFFLVIVINPGEEILHVLILILSSTMVIKAGEVFEYWLQSLQKSDISSKVRIISSVIITVLKFILVYNSGTLLHYAWIYFIDALIISSLLLFVYVRAKMHTRIFSFNIKYAKFALSQSWYLIAAGLMSSLYMQIDKIILGNISTSYELGLYSAASNISRMWYFIPIAVVNAMQPEILRRKTNSPQKSYEKAVQLMYTSVTWLGIIFGVGVSIFAKPIVSILYGEEFLGATTILVISAWTGIFATLGSARSVYLIAENLQKYSIIFIGSGLIINVILNFILIPELGGVGAAVASLVCQSFQVVVTPLFLKETRTSTKFTFNSFIFKL